jgi:LysM repeat protein
VNARNETEYPTPGNCYIGGTRDIIGRPFVTGCKDKPAGNIAENSLVTNLPSITFSNPPIVETTSVYPPPIVSNPPVVINPQPQPPVVTVGTPNTGLVPPPVGVGMGTVEPQPVSGGIIEHKIESGESFATIAKKYGVSVDAIIKANPNVNPRRLQIGQLVKVPEKSATMLAGSATTKVEKSFESAAVASNVTGESKTYVVKPGDNLTKIAKSQGVKISELKAANNLSGDRINVGQKLKIPVKNPSPITNPPSTPATDNLMNTTTTRQPTNV